LEEAIRFYELVLDADAATRKLRQMAEIEGRSGWREIGEYLFAQAGKYYKRGDENAALLISIAAYREALKELVYSYTTLNDPQALATGLTVANGINDAGEIVGLYADSSGYHGFLYSDGKYTTLNVPLAPYTYAFGINDKGQIVGLFGGYGFLYSDGRYTTLSDPQGQFTQAYGINTKGQIVGQFTDSSGTRHGFLYSDGKYATIGDPLATNGTFLRGINNKGQIVGQYIDSGGEHGFLYSGGKYRTINDPLVLLNHKIAGGSRRDKSGKLLIR
jgi:probable HAF family extracellular repeat protein